MAQDTAIAWTDHTFNIAWGCVKVSPACKNCYADTLSGRYGHDVFGLSKPRRTLSAKYWSEPHKWNQAAKDAGEKRLVFCSSMCDVFEDHPTIAAERGKLWALIRATPHLIWQILTKRPERIADCLPDDWENSDPDRGGYENVWLGTSIENNDYAHRADCLRAISAALRFISYEPALGPLDQLDLAGIGWVIYGGESGPGHRPHDLAWPRGMRTRCASAGIPFFYKQSPAHRTEMGIELDGEIVREYPGEIAKAK